MVRGAEDYFGLRAKIEATIRPTLIYSTGRVIMFDTFSDPVQKWTSYSDASTQETITTAAAFSDGGCLRLDTTSGSKSSAAVAYYLGLTPVKKVGVQCEWCAKDENFWRLTWYLKQYDGTLLWDYDIRYLPVENKWMYRSSLGVWTDIPGSSQELYCNPSVWHHFKMIIDLVNHKILTLFSDDLIIDMSDLSFRSTSSEVEPALWFGLGCIGPAVGVASYELMDNIMFTEEV